MPFWSRPVVHLAQCPVSHSNQRTLGTCEHVLLLSPLIHKCWIRGAGGYTTAWVSVSICGSVHEFVQCLLNLVAPSTSLEDWLENKVIPI